MVDLFNVALGITFDPWVLMKYLPVSSLTKARPSLNSLADL